MNTKPHNRVDGIYFNTSPDPAFVDDVLIGGHDYVYVEGYIRIPGQFVMVDDPKGDDDVSETFRKAYEKMREVGESHAEELHANSANSSSNVVPVPNEVKGDTKATKSKRESAKPTSINQ